MTTNLTTVKIQVMEIASSACWACWTKAPIAYTMGFLTYMLGGQNFEAGIAIIVLVSIDFVTALMAEYKIGNPIESRKALKGMTKLVVYSLFLSAIHLTEMILPGTTFLDEAALSYLALTEAISVLENIGKMGYPMPLLILNRLKNLKDKSN